MKNRKLVLLVITVVLAFSALWLLLPMAANAPVAAAPEAGETLRQAAQGLDDIQVEATYQPEEAMLLVTQTMRLVNRTGQPQAYAVFRTYPNAFRTEDISPIAIEQMHSLCYPDGFSVGWLEVQYARFAEGDEAAYAYADPARTVLRVTVPNGWQPDAELRLTVRYAVKIPMAAYRFGTDQGMTALGNALLIPAAYLDGAWFEKEYYPIGDPFVSECRNYTVSVRVPRGYTVAASAYAVGVETDDSVRYDFKALAVRDFAMCISSEYQATRQTTQDGVLITAIARTDENAQKMLIVAVQAMRCFGERFGAYPYPSYTLCEISFPFGGMEYPAMVMMAADTLAGSNAEWAIVHETAHQWWYAVVGNDEYNQAWLDEALSEYSTLLYIEDTQGAAARADQQERRVDSSLRVTVPAGITPGAPVDDHGDMNEYALVVYERGAAMLCALETAMEGTLDEFLSNYYHTYAFAIASRENFETLLRDFSGEDWSPLLSDYLDTYIRN